MITGTPFRRPDESHALGLAALAGPIIAIYTPLGLAPLFALVSLAALAAGWSKRPWQKIERPLLVMVALILAWAALSITWTINPPQALKTLAGLIGTFAGGLILVTLAGDLDPLQTRRVRLALVSGIGVGLALLILELAGFGPGALAWKARQVANMPYFLRLGRGLTITQLLLPLAILAAWRMNWRRAIWALAALGIIAPMMGHTLAAKVALISSATILLLTLASRRLPTVAATVMILALAAFPLVSLTPDGHITGRWGWLPHTGHHRLTIWTFTAKNVLDHPIAGWGLDASRDIPDAERVEHYLNDFFGEKTNLNEQMLPLHPHNVSGQIWLELGGIGAALIASLIAFTARRIQRRDARAVRALMTCSLVAAFAISSVSYGIWQNWWLAGLWFAAALGRAVGKDDGVPGDETLQQGKITQEGSDALPR